MQSKLPTGTKTDIYSIKSFYVLIVLEKYLHCCSKTYLTITQTPRHLSTSNIRPIRVPSFTMQSRTTSQLTSSIPRLTEKTPITVAYTQSRFSSGPSNSCTWLAGENHRIAFSSPLQQAVLRHRNPGCQRADEVQPDLRRHRRNRTPFCLDERTWCLTSVCGLDLCGRWRRKLRRSWINDLNNSFLCWKYPTWVCIVFRWNYRRGRGGIYRLER